MNRYPLLNQPVRVSTGSFNMFGYFFILFRMIQRVETPLVQVLNQQQAWLPGLQEYLPPWWLSCLTGPEAHAPMAQQARKSWTLVLQED